MSVPENVQRIDVLRYDVRVNETDNQLYKDIEYVDPSEMLKTLANADKDATNTEAITLDSNTVIYPFNDRAPRRWTTLDQKTIIFDAYDSNLESNLLESKTQCFGTQKKELVKADYTVIDLPRELYVLLESNATELAFDLWKGVTPRKITDLARKARVRMQRNKDRLRREGRTGPNYGRITGKGDPKIDGIASGQEDSLPSWWPKD
jgi:hypothetical protein